MKSHVIGLFLGFFIIYYAATNTSGDNMAYVDVMSMIIVMGGSFCVSIMTNGIGDTAKICSMFFKVFETSKFDNLTVTRDLVEIAKKAHHGPLDYQRLSQDVHHPFVDDGLRLLQNKFEPDKVRNILSNMMMQRQEVQDQEISKLEVLAKYPPAFGMMGTIIGLVSVLKQLGGKDGMENMGPAMAVALVTTLYGILISNYIILPIADNLTARSLVDIKMRQLIAEGMIMIADGHDPIYIREALLSFLTPQERAAFTKGQGLSVVTEEVAA